MRADLIYLHQTIADLLRENSSHVDTIDHLRSELAYADERASEDHEHRAEEAETEALKLRSQVFTLQQKLEDITNPISQPQQEEED